MSQTDTTEDILFDLNCSLMDQHLCTLVQVYYLSVPAGIQAVLPLSASVLQVSVCDLVKVFRH